MPATDRHPSAKRNNHPMSTSNDPADALVRELIRTGRGTTPTEVERIVLRVAASTFNPARRNIPRPLRELIAAAGYQIPERGDDLLYHWAKHVIGDQQWSSTTTAEEYWQDILRLIANSRSGVLVQPVRRRRTRGDQYFSGVIIVGNVRDVVAEARLGPRAGAEFITIYNADTGRLCPRTCSIRRVRLQQNRGQYGYADIGHNS
jgi:hypothetical protein